MEENAVKRVIKIVKKYYKESQKIKNSVLHKELNDIVTDVDVFMEENIIKELKKFYPTHSFYAEESGQTLTNNNAEDFFQWLIDPIDGTINYAAGLPLFATSVALQKNGETILGVVFDHGQGDIYTAIAGKGAFKNSEKLQVSKRKKLSDCIVSFCLTSHYNEEHTTKILDVAKKLSPKLRGLRLIVSSAIELCWLASGKIDGVINIKPSVGLSSAAGKLFITETGGKVTNVEGDPRQKIDTMLCTNGMIHDEIVKLVK